MRAPAATAVLPPSISASLQRAGLITNESWRAEPLSGGVSSDIFLVQPDGGAPFVVKSALPRLRVASTWEADPRRNASEHRWFRRATALVPGHVPAVLYVDDDAGCFAMEYIVGLRPWKQDLLGGIVASAPAATAGRILGQIHAATWGSAADRANFDTGALFFALRIEPYLLATGRQHPALRALFEAEGDRLGTTTLALIHGDYSPKNLLVGDTGRFIIVDAEVAYFGDPAFDVAFLLNHLLLKALHHAPEPAGRACLALFSTFLSAYMTALDVRWTPDIEERTIRLLLMLLLARVDGKSPAEYLASEPARGERVRAFVRTHLPAPPATLTALAADWTADLFPA